MRGAVVAQARRRQHPLFDPALGVGEPGEPRVALDLPGYGVALYRFHLSQSEIPERGAPDRVSAATAFSS